jgi:hypothetical protein
MFRKELADVRMELDILKKAIKTKIPYNSF